MAEVNWSDDESVVRAVYPKAYFDYPNEKNCLVRIREGNYPNSVIGCGNDLQSAWAAARQHPTVQAYERLHDQQATADAAPMCEVATHGGQMSNYVPDYVPCVGLDYSLDNPPEGMICADCRCGFPFHHATCKDATKWLKPISPTDLDASPMQTSVEECTAAIYVTFTERSNLTWREKRERVQELVTAALTECVGTLEEALRAAHEKEAALNVKVYKLAALVDEACDLGEAAEAKLAAAPEGEQPALDKPNSRFPERYAVEYRDCVTVACEGNIEWTRQQRDGLQEFIVRLLDELEQRERQLRESEARAEERAEGIEITPSNNGTVSLEWEHGGRHVYVEIGLTRVAGFIEDPLVTMNGAGEVRDAILALLAPAKGASE